MRNCFVNECHEAVFVAVLYGLGLRRNYPRVCATAESNLLATFKPSLTVGLLPRLSHIGCCFCDKVDRFFR